MYVNKVTIVLTTVTSVDGYYNLYDFIVTVRPAVIMMQISVGHKGKQ